MAGGVRFDRRCFLEGRSTGHHMWDQYPVADDISVFSYIIKKDGDLCQKRIKVDTRDYNDFYSPVW